MIRLYAHGGSGNHGCEALVRSTLKILESSGFTKRDTILYTYAAAEDKKYIPKETFGDIVELTYKKGTPAYYFYAALYKLGWKNAITHLQHRHLFEDVKKEDICLCMGGDTYTYDGWPELLAFVNARLRKKGARTVLWGCSLSKELFNSASFIEDMKNFDLITTRERITYQMLAAVGIKDNVILVSDPAFTLDTIKFNLKDLFDNTNGIIGLNLSPLIMSCESKENMTLLNYQNLINHILNKTNYNIALIPHVVWDGNDDRKAIDLLLKDTDTDRIKATCDMDCCRIKGCISECELFIGARTHSTIAAYSNSIPTLVVGYSVKAKGIAESLFGTFENYVLPVQELKEPSDLTRAFEWLESNKTKIHNHLVKILPSYKENCYAGIKAINRLK